MFKDNSSLFLPFKNQFVKKTTITKKNFILNI